MEKVGFGSPFLCLGFCFMWELILLFATILAGTGAVAKVRVVPDSAITSLTKRLQPCAAPSISAAIRAKPRPKAAIKISAKLC